MSGTRRARSSGGASALASSPWIVVATGVVAMVVLLIVALAAARRREPAIDARPDNPPATMSLPELPSGSPSQVAATVAASVVPELSPRRTGPPTSVPTGHPGAPSSAGKPGAAPRPTPPPAPRSPVTGRYRVLEAYDDEFIGEVLLTNAAAGPRPWTVRLVPPAGSRLADSWVEGAPQGTARMSDGVFTYTSGVDLDGGAYVQLQFRFEDTGGATRPSSCTVDGAACSGL